MANAETPGASMATANPDKQLPWLGASGTRLPNQNPASYSDAGNPKLTKVACVCVFIRVPVIILVGIFGCIAELYIDKETKRDYVEGQSERKWKRGFWKGEDDKFACVVHNLTGSGYISLSTFAPETAEFLDGLRWDVVSNKCIGVKCRERSCGVAITSFMENTSEMCNVDLDKSLEPLDPTWAGGAFLQQNIPLALVWMIYKLTFIGVYPIDRVISKFDDQLPFLFRCVTEPGIDWRAFSAVGIKHWTLLTVKIMVYLRYMLLPNCLLTSLTNIEFVPGCRNYLFYAYDTWWSKVIYLYVLVDLVITYLVYFASFGLWKAGVGNWKWVYTCLSCQWLCCWWSLGTWAIVAGIGYLTTTLSLPNLLGFNFSIVFGIQTQMYWAVEAVQILIWFNTTSEFIQLLNTVLGILGPLMCPETCGMFGDDWSCGFSMSAVRNMLTDKLTDKTDEKNDLVPTTMGQGQESERV